MRPPAPVLIVEDNPHDILAIKRAWKQHGIPNPLCIVEDGEACINFLFHPNEHKDISLEQVPCVAIIDIKLPKIDGLSLLKTIRQSEPYQYLPVVMFTTSAEESDRVQSYYLGANAYVRKPMGYQAFSSTLHLICQFWSTAEPPGGLQ